mgnify:CR=1 FL=1
MRAALAALLLFLFAPVAQARDVTATVLADTDLGARVAAACQRWCQGNKREGTVRRVDVETGATKGSHAVTVVVRLRNHQQEPARTILGQQIGPFDIFDYAIDIEAGGTLDDATCRLRIQRVRISDDRLGLMPQLKKLLGTEHQVANCGRFL